MEEFPSPAVTLRCDWKIGLDWNGRGGAPQGPCLEKFTKAEDVWQCFKNNSFGPKEVIMQENQVGDWKLDLTEAWSAVHMTRENHLKIETKPKSYLLMLNKSNPTISVILHDPDYFIINRNPETIPKLSRPAGYFNQFTYMLYVQVTQVKMLNLPASPCEESASYIFTKCIKNFVTKVISSM